MLLAQTQKEGFLPNIDKENHAVNANRKANFLIKKHNNKVAAKSLGRSVAQTNFEDINNQGPQKTKFAILSQNMKDLGYAKKINANKVKKLLNFEKETYYGRKEYVNAISFKEKQLVIPSKSKFSFLNKNINKESAYNETGRRSTGLNHIKPDLHEVKEEPINFAFLRELQANAEKSFLRETSDDEFCAEELNIDQTEQTNKMVREYANDIIATLKEKDENDKAIYCLKNHRISPNLRAKMVDWMIEVMCSYKCSDQSFFLAVSIMDSFLDKTEVTQTPNDLHLLGVTCMFIAGKFEEIYPMRLSLLCEKVAHGKLTKEEIMVKEGEILNVLGFNLSFATIYNFITNIVFQLNLKDTMSSDLYEYLLKVCIYLSKANMYDYETLSQYNYSQLAASILLVAFKVIEQLDMHFPLANMMFKVCEVLDVDDSVLYGGAGKILSLVKGFDKLYPTFKNLKKFHFIGLPGDDKYNEELLNQGAGMISNL